MFGQDLNLERMTFLVADSNRHMRSIVKNLLHSFGARDIRDADDGADALDRMQICRADMVICDLMMEGMNGIEFTQTIRHGNRSPNREIPIIMLSSSTERHLVVAAREAGVNDLLAKPVSAEALFKRIREAILYPRPFIRVGRYYGPDRRKKSALFTGPERRIRDVHPDGLVFIPQPPRAAA